MGLVVDEIVDIVEDKLDIEVTSSRPGALGFAVIKGATTEIIDVGYFLPQAFEDWFRRRDMVTARPARTVLLVDDSPFFRGMLALLIKAAGYRVVAVGSAAEALAALKSDARFDLVVTDIEMPDMDGFALAEAVRDTANTADIPIIPINIDRKLARVASGVFRLDGQLLVVLDVDRVLDLGVETAAAA